MNKKMILLSALYCAVSGVKSLMDTAVTAAVTEMIKSKLPGKN